MSGSDLLLVVHDRRGAFRAVDGETGAHGLAIREDVVSNPGHGEIGHDLFLISQLLPFDEAHGRVDDRTVSQHDPLGVPGGPGRVGDDGKVIGLALVDFILEVGGVVSLELAPQFLYVVKGQEPGMTVVPHAPRVVIENILKPGYVAPERHQLVGLFLVFRHGESGLRMIQDIMELLFNGILVKGHRHPSKTLAGGCRPVKLRAVVADDRHFVVPFKAQRGQAQGKILDLGRDSLATSRTARCRSPFPSWLPLKEGMSLRYGAKRGEGSWALD